jgi:putative endonuclease
VRAPERDVVPGDPIHVTSRRSEAEDRWFCYLLECADGTFYTGITSALDRRLSLHNRGRASRYTRGRLPVTLVYAEPHRDRSSASRRERAVKKMSRAEKRALGRPATQRERLGKE